MENVIIVTVLAAIVILTSRYLYLQKKRGVKCVGCPEGCSGACSGCSGCHNN